MSTILQSFYQPAIESSFQAPLRALFRLVAPRAKTLLVIKNMRSSRRSSNDQMMYSKEKFNTWFFLPSANAIDRVSTLHGKKSSTRTIFHIPSIQSLNDKCAWRQRTGADRKKEKSANLTWYTPQCEYSLVRRMCSKTSGLSAISAIAERSQQSPKQPSTKTVVPSLQTKQTNPDLTEVNKLLNNESLLGL